MSPLMSPILSSSNPLILPDRWPVLRNLIARENCAFYASEFLRGPSEPPYNGKFFAARHHEEWAELANDYKRLCIIAARGHGKCQPYWRMVLSADGSRIPIARWTGGDIFAFDERTEKFVRSYSPPAQPNGFKICYRIRTRTGRETEVTANHPLLTQERGWVVACELNIGEKIAAPRELEVFGDATPPSPWLLGLIVGDGTLNEGCSPSFTSGDQYVIFEATREAEVRGWWLTNRGPLGFAIIGPGQTHEEKAKHWLRELGLLGTTAPTKHVPSIIFQSTKKTVAEFLAGYLDSDGSVNMHGGGAVEFYSVSERLLREVQHLLIRFGVTATLAPKKGKYKGETHWSWRLTLRGQNVLRFAKYVHPRGARKDQLNALVQYLEPRARALPDEAVLWDEIEELENIGEHETWAMTVPGLENYVADDIVQHNSFFWTFAYPLWMAERYPGREGYIFSASQPQAENILIRIMREVEQNPKLAHFRPKTSVKTSAGTSNKRWSAKTLELGNGFTIHARGYGTKVRGGHPVFICLDDILNDETAFSETVRTKEIDYFFSAVTNMIEPTGQIVMVGTPQHNNDIFGVLKKTPSYTVKSYPAIQPDGTALWPERFSRPELDKILDEIKTLRFSREFMCESISDLSSLFPLAMFKGDPVEQFNAKLGVGWKWWRERGVSQIFMGVDFALSTETGMDYTVIFVLGVDDFGNRWVIDIIRDRGLSFGEQKSRIVDAARKYRPTLILVESVQAQRIFGDELIRTTDLPVRHYVTGSEKHTLDRGLPSLRVLLENRKIRIPRGDEYSIGLTDIWIEEMRAHSFSSGRIFTTAEHDDTCYAFWICDQAVRNGNFAFSFGEEEGDETAYNEMMDATLNPSEDEDEWGDFIPGAVARRGRPRRINAGVIDVDEVIDEEDNPRDGHSMPKLVGQRPSAQTKDWRPKDQSPKATDFFGLGGR
jgi:hypothetical protein